LVISWSYGSAEPAMILTLAVKGKKKGRKFQYIRIYGHMLVNPKFPKLINYHLSIIICERPLSNWAKVSLFLYSPLIIINYKSHLWVYSESRIKPSVRYPFCECMLSSSSHKFCFVDLNTVEQFPLYCRTLLSTVG